MDHRRRSNARTFLLGFIIGCISFSGGYPPAVSEAACPPASTKHQGWPANATVYYQSTGFTTQELDQIGGGGALGSWNFHNTIPPTLNCSKVYFQAAPPSGQLTITAANDQDPDVPSTAAATRNDTISAGKLAAATITFHWAAVRINGSPTWNRDGSSGYYSFVRKVMLHEAGHTMGLGDVDPNQQVAGQSVMK